MILTLDGQRIDSDVRAGATLRDVVDEVREARLHDRLVVRVAVDGTDLLGDELEQRLGEALGAVRQIDLESAEPVELVVHAFESVAAEIAAMLPITQDVAKALRAGQSRGALRDLGSVVGLWHAAHHSLSEASGVLQENLALRTILFGGQHRSVESVLTELTRPLEQLRSALDARDHVLVADLLSYEMPGVLNSWQELFRALARALS